jgi:hypothetical protein
MKTRSRSRARSRARFLRQPHEPCRPEPWNGARGRRGSENDTEDEKPFTFTGTCTFTFTTVAASPVVPSRRTARGAAGVGTNRKSKTGLGLGFGLGLGWSSRAVLIAGKGVPRLTDVVSGPGIFPPLPPGEGCWRLSEASGDSGVRAHVASHGHACREEELSPLPRK